MLGSSIGSANAEETGFGAPCCCVAMAIAGVGVGMLLLRLWRDVAAAAAAHGARRWPGDDDVRVSRSGVRKWFPIVFFRSLGGRMG